MNDMQFRLDLRMVAHAGLFDGKCDVSRHGVVEGNSTGLVSIVVDQQESGRQSLRLVIDKAQAVRLGQLLLMYSEENDA